MPCSRDEKYDQSNRPENNILKCVHIGRVKWSHQVLAHVFGVSMDVSAIHTGWYSCLGNLDFTGRYGIAHVICQKGKQVFSKVSWNQSTIWISLVAQWLRIRLPMQGARVRALVREDPTCRGATKPVRRNYWAREPQLLSPRAATTEPCVPRARAPQQEKPPQWEARAPQRRVAPTRCN